MMIKIKPILLLIILTLPVGSTYLLFKQRQYQVRKDIKRQIKRGVKDSDLVLLKIPKALESSDNNVFKRKHSKEFRYNGNMYDIVRQKSLKDTTLYWCILDSEETKLFAGLDEMFHHIWSKDPVKKTNNERLFYFLKNFFCNSLFIFNHCKDSNKNNFAIYELIINISDGYYNTPSPPP